MAAVIPTFTNEVRHYPDQPDDETVLHYGGQFYGGTQTYGGYTIQRARTRFKNESRYKDEDTIR